MMEAYEVPEALAFSRQWVEAWNRHDVESVLEHFHEDVLFTSPVAGQIIANSAGAIHGKEALRAYWTNALRLFPDLRFEIEALHAGGGALAIRYQNQKGVSVNEVLLFRGGKVREGFGTYPSDKPTSVVAGER